MKKYIVDYLMLFTIAGLIVLLDQWTKSWVISTLPFGHIYNPDHWLTQFIRIVHWQNTGSAFGLFQGFGGIFTVLAFIVAGVIIYYYPQIPRTDWLLRIAMGMQLGGALGNLVDRLTEGHVTDFISVLNFPVFNIADASISVGTVILMFGIWDRERKEASARAQADETSGNEPENQLVTPKIPEDLQSE